MTEQHILEAIIDSVQRHASLYSEKAGQEVLRDTAPYPDLGMDSFHDVNISCEVQVILGIRLPPEMPLLFHRTRALSIFEATQRIASYLNQHPEAIIHD
jgi:acyl carrier protein